MQLSALKTHRACTVVFEYPDVHRLHETAFTGLSLDATPDH